MYSVCYIINFYFGSRRHEIEEQKNDKLFFLKKQIELLSLIKNDIDCVVFNFNIRPQDYNLIGEIFNIVPKKINNTIIEINFRENYGMSYAAFSEIFEKKMNLYDYFIFNEDDYIFVEDNWDKYLVKKFESLKNCGYLCMLVKNSNSESEHAGMSTGISSNKILSQIYEKYGELPHSKSNNYLEVENHGQIKQSSIFKEFGYKIYDIREDYKLLFFHPQNNSEFNVYFPWNDKEIICPIQKIMRDEIYFYIDFEKEFWMVNNNDEDDITFKFMNNSIEDLTFLLEIRNHPSTKEQLENNQIFTLNDAQKWFFSLKNYWYIIYSKNLPVGYFRIDGNQIGCDVHPKYRKQGIAKKAYIKYLKTVDYASLWVFDDNFAKDLYKKLGFYETEKFKFIRNRKYIEMNFKKIKNENY